MSPILKTLIVGLTVLSLIGCNLYSERMLRSNNNFSYESLPVSSKQEYKIEPYDKISFRMLTNKGSNLIESSSLDNQGGGAYYENKFSYQSLLVEHDGFCNFPKIGRVSIKDSTINQARRFLTKLYAKFYIDPFIQISVTNRRVMVFTSGSTQAKVVKLENDKTTLMEAIALAGGLDEKSKVKSIKLIRGELANPKVYKFDLRKLSGISQTNFLLEANDIIFIEDRKEVFRRTLSFISPIYALINTTAAVVILYNSFLKR